MTARILLAEDNRNLAQLLAGFLQKTGHEVSLAESGADTLRQLAGAPYDLLILDLGLPEINGVELLQKLRKSPRMSGLPVIIITGIYKGEKYAQAALKLGVHHYLEKPFSREAFAAAVDKTVAAIEAGRCKPSLLTMLLTIYNERQSGRLSMGDGSPIVFVNGEPAAFLAAGRSDFPAFLRSRGKITADDGQRFVESGASRLFFTEAGMLPLDELQSESQHFLTTMLLDQLTKKADFTFVPAAPELEPPLVYVPMARLFYEALQLAPEQFAGADLGSGGEPRYPAKTPRYYRLANFLTLREQDILLLERIDGRLCVDELLQGVEKREGAVSFLTLLQLLGMIAVGSAPGADAQPDFYQKTLFNRPLDPEMAVEEVAIDFDDIVEAVADDVVMAMGTSGMAEPLSAEEIGFEQTVQREYSQIKDKDYYAVFGMTPGKFSFNTLKEAYFSRVREFSPERFMELSGATSAMAQEILGIYAEAYNTLSNVVAKERYDELLNDNKTMGIDGKQDGQLHARIQFQSGKVFLDMGEFENAEKALQEAYTLEPENAAHAAFLAWAIYRNGANKSSRAAMEKVRVLLTKSLQIEKSAEAFAFRGWLLLDEGREGLAEGEFLKAVKINAKETNALKGLKQIAEKRESEKKGVLRRIFG